MIDAVKIGMLADSDVIRVVGAWLDRVRPPVVVLDPVMVATSGDRLLDPDAERALHDLLARATLVTPNLAELAVLSGRDVLDWEDALSAAEQLSAAVGAAVLVKGDTSTAIRLRMRWSIRIAGRARSSPAPGSRPGTRTAPAVRCRPRSRRSSRAGSGRPMRSAPRAPGSANPCARGTR